MRYLKRRKPEVYPAACGECMTEAWVHRISMRQMKLLWWTDTAPDPLLDVGTRSRPYGHPRCEKPFRWQTAISV